MPGPPFALGSILVFIAFFFLVAIKKIKATNKKNHGSFPEGIINDESVPLTEYVDID